MRKSMKLRLTLLLALMLVFLIGCESVGGLDLNKTLKTAMETHSMEGKLKLSVEITGIEPTEDMDEATREMVSQLALFSDVKLELDNVKMGSEDTISLSGTIAAGEDVIPLHAVIREEQIELLIDGAKAPFVIGQEISVTGAIPLIGALEQKIGNLGSIGLDQEKVMEMLYDYLLFKLPNPERLTVESAEPEINGEKVNALKVSAALDGIESINLIGAYIEELFADEAGQRELINELLAQSTLPNNFKTVAAELVYNLLAEEMESGFGSLRFLFQESDIPEVQQALEAYFGQIGLNLDLYVDDKLAIRKATGDLSFPLPRPDGLMASLKIAFDYEAWNVNGEPVLIDEIDLTGGYYEFDEATAPYEILLALDEDSRLYQLLRYEYGIARKNLVFDVSDAGVPSADEPVRPYLKPEGYMMLPVRYVTEQLDGDVSWNPETREVTIVDALSGTTIVFVIDSNIAHVNGVAEELAVAAEIIHDSTYVHSRFVAERFGAVVEWDDETKSVTITRD